MHISESDMNNATKNIAIWSICYSQRQFWVEALTSSMLRLIACDAVLDVIFAFGKLNVRIVQTYVGQFMKSKNIVRIGSRFIPMAFLIAISGADLYAASKWSGRAGTVESLLAKKAAQDPLIGIPRPTKQTITLGELIAALVLLPELTERPLVQVYMRDYVAPLMQPYMEMYEFDEKKSQEENFANAWLTATIAAWEEDLPTPFDLACTKAVKGADKLIVDADSDTVARLGRVAFLQGAFCPVTTAVSIRLTGLLSAFKVGASSLCVVTIDPSTGEYYDMDKVIDMVDAVIKSNKKVADFLERHREDIKAFLRNFVIDYETVNEDTEKLLA